MTLEVLLDVDAATVGPGDVLHQVEAAGYAAGLMGDPIPEMAGELNKREYVTPADITRTISAIDPEYVVTLRIFNIESIPLPMTLRSAINIAAGGISEQILYGKIIENATRFYLETKLGLLGNLLNIETFIGRVPKRYLTDVQFDHNLTYDDISSNKIDFLERIEKLISESQDLSIQKRAFDAMGRILQKQFSYISRDISFVGHDLDRLTVLAESEFKTLNSKMTSSESELRTLDSKLDEVIRRLPPPSG